MENNEESSDNNGLNNTEELSKAERKRLKKKFREEKKEEDRRKRQRRKRTMMIMKLGIVAVILFSSGFFLTYNSATGYISDSRGPPQMKINPLRYNFGDVSVAKGMVSTEMDIENTGKGNLVIKRMESSCMCTTASIIKDGDEGPKFGMHSGPLDWSQVIGPNETAQLKIYYDPRVHMDLRGPVTRSIKIFTNDPLNPMKEVKIDLTQVS